MATNKTPKARREFSKTLLIQESALMWIHTIGCLGLAWYCIHLQFDASLPWIAASVGLPWAAYGVSQVFYYKKSLAENITGGIKYESVLKELDSQLNNNLNNYQNQLNAEIDYSQFENNAGSATQKSDSIDIDYGI